MVRVVERWIPDSLVFAILLTFVVALMSLGLIDSSPVEVVRAWGDGLAGLLEFIAQISIVLALGYTLARLRGVFTLFQTTIAGPAMRGMIAEAQSDSEAARAFREEFMVRRRAVMRSILEKGVARGELREDLDLEVAIDLLTGAVWQRLLQGHAPMDDRYAGGAVEIALPGMLRPQR